MNSVQILDQRRISKSTILSVAALTFLFIGLYFVLRALPDAQCGFLHYEEIIHPDGTIEFCATNHAGFLDLTLLKYPVNMNISMSGIPVPGKTQEVTLELLTSGGMPIAPHELAITHTEKLHLLLIDPSLNDYHHIHPQPEGIDGKYTFQWTPQLSGTYQLFAEFVPIRTRRQVIATGTIEVTGSAAQMKFDRRTEDTVDGIRFLLNGVPDFMRTNVDYSFKLEILNHDGQPAVLEDIMGAKGHMVAFDEMRKGLAHMHPASDVFSVNSTDADADSELNFLFNVPNPGWYRLFAQVLIDGRELFGSFDLEVR